MNARFIIIMVLLVASLMAIYVYVQVPEIKKPDFSKLMYVYWVMTEEGPHVFYTRSQWLDFVNVVEENDMAVYFTSKIYKSFKIVEYEFDNTTANAVMPSVSGIKLDTNAVKAGTKVKKEVKLKTALPLSTVLKADVPIVGTVNFKVTLEFYE